MARLLVLRSKITPPRTSSRSYIRPRVQETLGSALEYRLTVLQAGAGYGKSTALAHLAHAHAPTAWYQLAREDADPSVFLLHLAHALRQACPALKGLPPPLLEHWDSGQGPLPVMEVLDGLLNALHEVSTPLLVVFDDVHRVLNRSDEVALLLNRFIEWIPSSIHVLLSSREPVHLPHLSRWQAQGEVFTLDQQFLAFREDEIAHLFAEHYHYPLTPDEVTLLHQTTEGWAIALHLVWQTLRTGAAASVAEALQRPNTPLEQLFEVLAHEVLAHQPEDVQRFLIQVATLRRLDPDACAALTSPSEARALLDYLEHQDLFVLKEEDGALRFHFMMHRFLRRLASEEDRRIWHLRAARHYEGTGNADEALYHRLKARSFEEAASLLEAHGQRLLAQGRLDTLAAYLDALPPEILFRHPMLLLYLGELARLRSRFNEALGWYRQAEALWRQQGYWAGVVRALHGQARVYLDTVNPAQAEALLQEALRLSEGHQDREALARMYELLAENRLNAGRPQDAERLRIQAQQLRDALPSDDEILFRVLLRTGRLHEARRRLEQRVQWERQHPVQTPRAHRETLLLLALVYAFLGHGEEALQAAMEGTARGERLGSPYVIAVGHMRQGHAFMLRHPPRYTEAILHFQQAVDASHRLAIPRLRVEACWGLCRAYGFTGALDRARAVAEEGVAIAQKAGDVWITSLVQMTMGAALTLARRHDQAEGWLHQAAQGFRESSDPFGLTATLLWLALTAFERGKPAYHPLLLEALDVAREKGYDFLFLRPTLLGPPDIRRLIPLLLDARAEGLHPAFIQHLLESLGLARLRYHPGYQLRVFTLGAFRVFRGEEEIPPQGWRRESSRRLFQLFLTFRHTLLERERILELLWPDLPMETALRNFKVALSVLYSVLEPRRAPGTPSAYIMREGSAYALRPEADLWLDAEVFERLLTSDTGEVPPERLEQAVALFTGEYLPDARYEAWAEAERHRLNTLFLDAADRLCEHYLRQHRPAAAVSLAQQMLQVDPCTERAYRHLMRAYALLGDYGQAAQVYQRCVETLQKTLQVPPSPETQHLYQQLLRLSI